MHEQEIIEQAERAIRWHEEQADADPIRSEFHHERIQRLRFVISEARDPNLRTPHTISPAGQDVADD